MRRQTSNIHTERTSVWCAHGGFTLIEMMIAMLMGAVVMGAVWASFQAQHRTYLVQDDTAYMQQNLRAAAEMLERDIRMAGYDPSLSGGGGITVAGANTITLSTWNDNTNAFDTIVYSLGDAFATAVPPTNDGDQDLLRSLNGGGAQPVAENIDALNFVYLDRTGLVTANPAEVRTVQISVIARAATADQNFVNSIPYNNLQGGSLTLQMLPGINLANPVNDNFRRRLYQSSVICRNLRR